MRKLVVPFVLVATLGLACVFPLSAVAQQPNPPVLPPTAHPYGQTYSEWAADWWQWALEQPTATNPVLDTTGAQCANDQQGKVWFLAGSFGEEPVIRECTVPTGTALLIPVLNAFYCAEPNEPQTEEFVREQVALQIADDATGLSVTIDGAAVSNVDAYFEESALFELTLPEGNIFGLPAGTRYPVCADAGYYVVVHPLPPGEHTINFTGTTRTGFSVDVTYHITVVAGR
jgi:hypothetical protein